MSRSPTTRRGGTPVAASDVFTARRTTMSQGDSERGAIGYVLMWLLGVPASVLFVIFLLRGCT
jgi:hypothetical protein